MSQRKNSWEVIYEDEWLYGVHKPSGLRSIPDRFDPDLPSLVGELRNSGRSVEVVHRLDKDTSGLMLFPKSEESHRQLSKIIQDREIEKDYFVLIRGHVSPDVGLIDAPIQRLPNTGRVIISPSGKPSQTKYRVLEQFRHYAFVEARLITGRTHQIRIHFHAYNMPFVCDPKYGDERGLYLSDFKQKYRPSGTERPLISRLSLHAHRLAFNHPFTNQHTEIQCDMPKDLRASLKQLRKWDSL